jgi:hypothetical protein
MKKIKVDKEKSLYYAANGRLKPAAEKETAEEKVKKVFVCPSCMYEIKEKKVQFGEHKICPKCEIEMLEEIIEG